MTRQSLRASLRDAIQVLNDAAVPSPAADAELIAAHVLGVERTRLGLTPFFSDGQAEDFDNLIARRARREPLQYITGVAAMGEIDLAVGPGVFIPRPETELLLGWALASLEACGAHPPRVIDLCSGTGALALAIAHARPDADVHAIEIDPVALEWLQRNRQLREAAGDSAITVYEGDVTDSSLLKEYTGGIDVIVANPPYVPSAASVTAEVADFEPPVAVFAGPDGLDVIRPMVANVARLLRSGGAVGIEHDDSNGAGVRAILEGHGGFSDVVEHPDLAGKPRFVTAMRI
ncbi:peptide chain release factor N(5)-glutamine methyltransferase [Hoyosella altamirensis]|uniref:Release factor glutamine methyltransferase n=1 Tax=Hoyosella altamirensis TaxID=616997 RepID=A0A839RJI0_9ACTN|nr:peptide chain release factor N(5)-glutamine methyltransferase [Hoyosella altamirensis]MBB3036161.1 release factor glutamine methyltransferase [Hoyosella altamirensis]